MAYDSQLYLRDSAVSNSLYTGSNLSTQGLGQTKYILLPGVPLRGLELNVVVPAAVSTPTVSIALLEAVSTGATPRLLRQLPAITTVGDYHYRFHPSAGYFAVSASATVTASSGGGFGNVEIRLGMDLGAFGNPQPS